MLNTQPEKVKTIELCKRLKDDPAAANIPLLVVLDKDRVTQIQYIFEAGVSKCMMKPFNKAYFKQAVNELIGEQ